ncbi:tRNA uracil 4-sulfurtransferase ThiI [Thermosipho ferrireducens]|uniref:tRNA uracil 4-sulfurtransferase ThiI n=1 Tax=Thermosipho ferrireducens TaxID=2571116 RepID=UPI001D18364D|nr:tRNA uracil 4-sulfurtransferase ThiI [Thermosipho ferrireducens]
MEKVILVRYSEIGLKGKNRSFFEKRLIDNIIKIAEAPRVNKRYGRLVIRLENKNENDILPKLNYVFGIQNVSVAYSVPHDFEQIKEISLELAREMFENGARTFKVETKKSFKKFPMGSYKISAEVGSYILKNIPGISVDVHNPEFKIGIEIKEVETFIFSNKISMSGGLPVGVAGKGLLLLSGGIDSPVAGWYMLKRGVDVNSITFLSPPYTSEKSVRKILDLAQKLSMYSPDIFKCWIVPFTEVQTYIKNNAPDEYSLILQRRSMMRIANKLARKIKAKALITGENLGQVASQTLTNLHSIEDASKLPVLRPLIGFDKIEIIDKAKEIGTYDISILPYIDSCVAFAPKRPATKSSLKEIEKIEQSLLELEELESIVYEKIEKYTFIHGMLQNKSEG